jgi:DNA polymerase-3 subunit beta
VELTATDIEVSLRLPLGAIIEEPGWAALPRITEKIARSMPDGHVVIESAPDGLQVNVSAGGSSFSLHSVHESDLPEIPADPSSTDATVRASDFRAAVARVARAASKDQMRPVLTGALVRLGEDALSMVTTDSYRLAVARVPLSSAPAEPREGIVPIRALVEFARIASALDAYEVEIALGDRAFFSAGGASLTGRLIEGQFPDFEKFVPESFEHEFTFNRTELLEAIKCIGTVAKDKPLRLRFASGGMTVAAINELFGHGEERIPAIYSGEPMEIGFNAGFLREGVEMVDDPEVNLAIANPLRPMMIHGRDKDAGFYLLMPMKLSEPGQT